MFITPLIQLLESLEDSEIVHLVIQCLFLLTPHEKFNELFQAAGGMQALLRHLSKATAGVRLACCRLLSLLLFNRRVTWF